MFMMQYNNFIQSSFSAIKKARENGLDYKIITKGGPIPTEPHNLYIELLAEKNKHLLKIEQWNFKCLKTIVQSEYQSNNDSQLDSVELQRKSFFTLLQQKLIKFNPKQQVKALEPKQLILSLTLSDKQLKPFYQDDIYLINIDEYEGNGFNCFVTLQTIETEMNRKQKQHRIDSSQQQFQVLHDSNYERQKQLNQQKHKMFKQISNSSQKSTITAPITKIQKVQQIIHYEQSDQKQKMTIKVEQIKKQINQQKQQNKIEYINISKYSTKQVTMSDVERKINLANDTVDLIRELNLGGDTLREFIKKL